MTWQPIPVVGGSAADETRLATPQETINWYPVRMERPGGRSDFILRSPSGMTHFTTVGTGPIRGDRDVEGTHFVVSGTRLYRVSHGGAVTELGVIPGEGMVSLTHNQEGGGYTVAVFNGPQGFTYNTITGVFAEITDPGFPGFRVGGFIDSYIAGIEKDGLFAAHSDLANASEYNTIDRYEAEAAPDLLVGQIIDHGEWWLMGRRTIEVYGNTGATTGTFQRIPGSTIERGLAAPFAVAKLDNSVFLLGDDGIAYRANGYNLVRISTQQEEQQFSRCDLSQAFAFTYEDRGHKVFYLTFPDGYTHGYDVASGEWHKRSSYGMDNWRISTLTRVDGRWIAGDRFNGKLYILDWDAMQDDSGPLVSERITGILHQNGDKLVVDGLMLVFDTGKAQRIAGPAPTIAGDAPDSAIGVPYSFSYTLGSGTPPYVVTLQSGELPPGLTLSSAGVLSGTPTTDGDYTFSVRVTDANDLWDEQPDELTILPAAVWLALLHFDGDFVDEVGNTWSSGTSDTDPVKFGSGSARVNAATGLSLCTRDFAADIGTDDWTIEAWIYRDSAIVGVVYDCIVGHWYADGTRSFQFNVYRTPSGDYPFLQLSSDGSAITTISGTDPVPYDELVHMRTTRKDGVVRIFVNGVQNGIGTFAGALKSNAGVVPGENWVIGGYDAVPAQNSMNGNIDEFAMLKFCLSDSNFTPPTAPYSYP